MVDGRSGASTAARVLAALVASGRSVAVAESLTGGAVCDSLVAVPGASQALRGGVVAYASEVKAQVLGVDAGLLAACGAVDPDVAVAMAAGVRRLLAADVGLATTGVAGPEPADGRPVGTVYVAVVCAEVSRVSRLALRGDRAAVRAGAVRGVLDLALEVLESGELAAGNHSTGS